MSINSRLQALEHASDQESEWHGLPLMISHDLDSDTYHVPGEAPPMTATEFDEWRATLEPGQRLIVINQAREDKDARAAPPNPF